MQCCESQMTRFSDPQSGFDGFEIAHFADQYYIGVLPQRRPQSLSKTFGVGIDLALIDDAALMIVKKFDWVLYRENVFVALLIYFVDYGCQRRRFTRPGWSSDKHQASRLVTQFFDYGCQTKFFEGFDLV